MYQSLLLPWSPQSQASTREILYRTAGLVRTKGTVFLLPPPTSTLRSTYNAPPRPKTRMSSGAVALCKHFERGGASSEHHRDRPHPFWRLPTGSNEEKIRVAEEVLEEMLRDAVWRNVLLLHRGIAVYEVRNSRGFGMRWTLDVVVDDDDGGRAGNCDDDGGGEEAVELGRSVAENGTVNSMKNYQTRDGGYPFDDNSAEADALTNWKITKTTFRGFLEPIEALDHELDGII